MVAPTNNLPVGGFNGDPLRHVMSVTWTEREVKAIKRRAGFGSRSRVIRSLIDAEKLETLIQETEADAASMRFN